jgi:hypothetical protein
MEHRDPLATIELPGIDRQKEDEAPISRTSTSVVSRTLRRSFDFGG